MAKYDPSKDRQRVTGYAFAVAAIGWVSLLLLVVQTLPWRQRTEVGQPPVRDPLTVFLFFIALFVTVGATFLPAAAYLNVRFGRFESRRVFQRRFVRQSILGGSFVVILAWMQMERMLTSTLALILLSVFVLTETFLITREMPKER